MLENERMEDATEVMSLKNSCLKILFLTIFKQGKDKHKHISDLEQRLSSVKITDFGGYEFHSLKGKTWNEVMATHRKLPTDQVDLRKQQEAVWELFASECTYFLDHLLVLKMIFMNTLKYLQTHEYLLDVDSWRLFANLEELSQTSYGFVSSLFAIIKDYFDASETSPPMDFISVLAKHFRGSLCQSHQTYCLNYSAAVFYLESLKQREDFGIYLKWCEQNEQCRRLHLAELLVAPLHRLTRYPLLLKNIWKRSTDSTEKIMIYSIKEKVEKSIQSTRFLDVYLFLFDDFLLVTKTKRNKKPRSRRHCSDVLTAPIPLIPADSMERLGLAPAAGASSGCCPDRRPSGAGGSGEALRGNRGQQLPLTPADRAERSGSVLGASNWCERRLQHRLQVRAGPALAVGASSGSGASNRCKRGQCWQQV
ncbi:Pleckstrin like proteiny domain-containing family G member 7 [Myotis brandtii]|uniref:Pleckstrin like proteiny domain-containing family G member 7 n=1 Tax=Myotis brandtii TaxID=109478 RepID=S7NAZ2_MYOBR|nr:Pleckstrin like proteiny domain-containing family G member 7 [Myotis brandtii]